MENYTPDWITRDLVTIGGLVGRGVPRFRIIRADTVTELYDGKWIPKYWTKRQRRIVGYWVVRGGDMIQVEEDAIREHEICVPISGIEYIVPEHFVLEQWLYPGSYARGWEVNRSNYVDGLTVDVLGGLEDQSGYFWMHSFIGEKGEPMEPGQHMLDYTAQKWRETINDPIFKDWTPDEPVPANAIQKAMVLDDDARRVAAQKESQNRYETIMNIFQPMKKILFHPKPNAGGGRLVVR